MAPIRVGIIGLSTATDLALTGSWGVFAHLRSLQALPGLYEIVAIANSSIESAQRSIEAHNLPTSTKAYGNSKDIAADPDVDLVVVSVTVPRHYAIVMPILEQKKSVFVEWPLGATVKEAEEMARLAFVNGIKNMVALQGRL
jgi:predicted dehydrogenase